MLATGARALFAVILGTTAAEGQGDVTDEPESLRIGGYVRTLAGLQQLPYEGAPDGEGPGPPESVGLSATVLRLEWKLALGERFSAEAHQRAFLRINSDPIAPAGGRLGLGASVVPRRSLNLRIVAYDQDHLLLEHDLDRLVLRANLGPFDVSVGRQAITWGTGEIFPVADLWANYSPFELDTSQKRGIDALRVLFSYSRAWELEAVLADRGSLKDLSGGLRVATYRQWLDAYFAVAKQWRLLLAMLGTAATAGHFKLRAEAVGPLDLDQRDVMPPRLALGVDWLTSGLRLTLEAHFNGTGVRRTDQYATHLAGSPAVAHGESYLLGRLYTGAAAHWRISELFALTVTGICNLQDPSVLVAGAFSWSVTQDIELTLGAFEGIGRRPLLGTTPTLRSEFGTYGRLVYLALASYF
jgi:hypothetical protein